MGSRAQFVPPPVLYVKSDGVIGTGTQTVHHGATLGFRSHAYGPALNYTGTPTIYVSGQGIYRQTGYGHAPVGAIYHDGGNNTFAGNIVMTGDTWFGARADRNGGLTLNGVISGGYTFVMVGPGLITLGAANTWSGDTHISGGVLRLAHADALPSRNLILGGGSGIGGGILELGVGDFSRNLGTGINEVQWWGSGGFSASGGDRTVTLGSSTLTWGTGNFVWHNRTLLLSSRYADSVITLKNAIDLNNGLREIRAERGKNVTAHGVLSGKLSGTGGIHKTGPGLLHITNSENDYSGVTRISEGVLRGAIPWNSPIELDGGVLGLDANFTRSLGSGPGQIRWVNGGAIYSGVGGFAAYGGDRWVTLGGSTAQINWGSADFIAANRQLRFGHYTADGTVIWNRPLRTTGPNQFSSIYVERGKDLTRADVLFTQPLIPGGYSGSPFYIVGNGRMDSSANNSAWTIALGVIGAEFRLHGEGRFPQSYFWLTRGATITLDNVGTHDSSTGGYFVSNRLRGLLSWASTLRIIGRADNADSIISMETIDFGGANVFDIIDNSPGKLTEIQAYIGGGGGTVNFTSNSPFITNGTSGVRLKYPGGGNPGAIGAIQPWATMNGTDWSGVHHIGVLTLAPPSYFTGPSSQWSSTHNVSTVGGTMSGPAKTINSLRLTDSALTLNANLTINSGGILSTGANTTISGTGAIYTSRHLVEQKNEEYAFIPRPIYVHVYGNSLTFSGSVRFLEQWDSNFNVYRRPDFIKTGPGMLIFNSSATSQLKNIYIHQGTLRLVSGQINTAPDFSSNVEARVYVGDGAGRDVLELAANSNNLLSPYSRVTLRGTPLDPGRVWSGGDMAIISFGGNTKQSLSNLHIETRGMIDFGGGETWAPNILYLDTLTIEITGLDTGAGLFRDDARLFLKNWYEFEDYLLVRKNQFDSSILSKIIFEGYEDFQVLNVDYNWDYWEIKPFNSMSRSPEPETYGAILGAMGLGLWTWRRWRKKRGQARPSITPA